MSVETRKTTGGLGRGLAALIPSSDASVSSVATVPIDVSTEQHEIDIEAIRPNPQQPRRTFDAEALRDLSASIKEHGVIQPVLVVEELDGFVLIAGERRLRAASQAGLTRIPAIVRTANEQERLSLALVENIQRADLNPIDEALGFRRLIDEFGLTQEEVAQRVGRSRPAVANSLRLLDVAPEVRTAVVNGTISGGHARALAGLDDQTRQTTFLATVVARSLSVRQTEGLVAAEKDGTTPSRTRVSAASADPDMQHLESRLREALGTKVSIAPGRNGGRITINWYDDDDLGRLVDAITSTDGRRDRRSTGGIT